MTLALLIGAGLGAGLMALYRLAVPAPPDLAAQAARWDRARARAGRRAARVRGFVSDPTPFAGTAGPAAPGGRWLPDRLSTWLADEVRCRDGARWSALRRDLAITETSPERWIGKCLTLATSGLLAPVALAAAGRLIGVTPPVPAAPVLGVALAVLMLVLSVQDLRGLARRRREEFRRALSIYLDLVAMSMEAGRGHAEAVPAAAGIGAGWAFRRLQDAIEGARFAGTTPWEALGQLGERLGVTELVELRGSLALAHDDGARIRGTLVARSHTLRDARLADTEARARTATQAMAHVIVVMAIVVVAYEVYPQVMRLFTAS